ncbi:MAG: NADH-quinone oxidoreductase subunit J [Myxococcota bacterium]
MSGPGAALFIVTAIFAIVGAIITVSARRPLRAAMGLLVHIVSLAGMFLTLNAHLLAALQLLVYAGAIVVLFVFVIMLIGPETETGSVEGMLVSRATAGALTAGIFLVVASSVASYGGAWGSIEDDFGTVEALGTAIYKQALVPFELISITLLVAIVGAIAIARSKTD